MEKYNDKFANFRRYARFFGLGIARNFINNRYIIFDLQTGNIMPGKSNMTLSEIDTFINELQNQ